MPAVTGTAGGRNGSAPDLENVQFYRSLLTGAVDLPCLDAHLRTHPTPVNVSMVVNNSCNLSCRHCYLQVPTLADRALGEAEWERVFATALADDTTMLSLNGKEVFLGTKGPGLLHKLVELRRRIAPEKRIGVITNGTLIAPHRQLIEGAHLTFLDISVDGLPEDHDAIRGPGAFAAVRPNLEWAAQILGPRAFVSLTAQKRNLPRFNEAVLHMNGLGIQHVGVSFYHPAPYNDTGLTLSAEDHDRFFRELRGLGAAQLDRPLTVFVEVDTLCPEALTAFLRSDWFSLDRIEMDRSRVPWIDYAFPNGFRMQFKFFPIPWAGYHSVRITPEGSVLSVDDIFDTRLYPLRILATARENGFDFPAMMRAAQDSPRVGRIIGEYHRTLLPRLVGIVAESVT
ncbi:MAG TPA: radical SAM protein [Verrucomicrobiae bacterium]|nr:radical SAM protein [Verrucomicrobiae bacterium]